MRGIGRSVAALLLWQCLALPAFADNPMGYRLLSAEEAAGLPRNGGALGLQVARARQIADSGMVFELMQIRAVRQDSAGDRAGLHVGDQIIALDGRVFPSIAAFAAYVGAASPGRQLSVDFMPAGSGPQQAQRMSVIVGAAGQTSGPVQGYGDQVARPGMSTGTKVAIGAGAVALLGCYEAGCFSRHRATPQPPTRPY